MIDRSGCPAKKHGDSRAYISYRCRCPDARRQEKAYRIALQQGRHFPDRIRRVPAVGAHRRLVSLATLGYRCEDLVPLIGCSRKTVERIRVGKIRWLYGPLHERIDRVWKELTRLADHEGIRGPSEEAARRALAKGCPSIVDWDGLDIDDPNVEPATQPDVMQKRPQQANREEMRHLLLLGESPERVARRLGLSVKTVEEYAAEVLPLTYGSRQGRVA